MPPRPPKALRARFQHAIRRLLPARKSEAQSTESAPPGTSRYPVPVDQSLVGQWPPLTKSGGGYFYDEVLEYRVWIHPEAGGQDLENGDDYFYAFAVYEEAATFAASAPRAEKPIALVRQYEWVDEPQPGVYQLKRGERITEWRADWLLTGRHTGQKVRELLARGRTLPEPSDTTVM
jgi:hypothetical protein